MRIGVGEMQCCLTTTEFLGAKPLYEALDCRFEHLASFFR
jgi:hypothetical protein